MVITGERSLICKIIISTTFEEADGEEGRVEEGVEGTFEVHGGML